VRSVHGAGRAFVALGAAVAEDEDELADVDVVPVEELDPPPQLHSTTTAVVVMSTEPSLAMSLHPAVAFWTRPCASAWAAPYDNTGMA
jgi:hypothetical protein